MIAAYVCLLEVQEEPDEGTMPRSLLYTVAEEKFVSDAGGKSALTMDTSEAVGMYAATAMTCGSMYNFLIKLTNHVFLRGVLDAADLVSASIMQSIVLRHVVSPTHLQLLLPTPLMCFSLITPGRKASKRNRKPKRRLR
jgi:hypothetical protein